MKLTRKAFTLVELIIVIAIIAVLAVSAFMVLTKWLGKSRDSRRLGDVGAIERALTTWLSDYDANGEGTLAAVTEDTTNENSITNVSTGSEFDDYFEDLKADGFDVLQKVVSDPNGSDQYRVAIANGFKLFSIGATLENDGTYKTAIRQNYQAFSTGANLGGGTWSGGSLMSAFGADKTIALEDNVASTTALPYSLVE